MYYIVQCNTLFWCLSNVQGGETGGHGIGIGMGLQSLGDQLFYKLVGSLLKNISMVNSSVQLGVQNIKK